MLQRLDQRLVLQSALMSKPTTQNCSNRRTPPQQPIDPTHRDQEQPVLQPSQAGRALVDDATASDQLTTLGFYLRW